MSRCLGKKKRSRVARAADADRQELVGGVEREDVVRSRLRSSAHLDQLAHHRLTSNDSSVHARFMIRGDDRPSGQDASSRPPTAARHAP
jgi:hypothetical protein